MTDLMYISCIHLEGLSKTMINLALDIHVLLMRVNWPTYLI
jgi:hypothetical protein